MPDPSTLAPGAVDAPERELHTAEVSEDATAADQDVKCVIADFGTRWSTNPLPWVSVTTAAGEFFPKRGDRGLVATPADGPEVLVWFKPSADAVPDVSF